jgi:hypothetical protein
MLFARADVHRMAQSRREIAPLKISCQIVVAFCRRCLYGVRIAIGLAEPDPHFARDLNFTIGISGLRLPVRL